MRVASDATNVFLLAACIIATLYIVLFNCYQDVL